MARDDDVEEAAARGASAFYADPTRGTSSGLCTNGLRKSVTLFLLREGRERRHSLSLPDVTYLASLDLTLGVRLFAPPLSSDTRATIGSRCIDEAATTSSPSARSNQEDE